MCLIAFAWGCSERFPLVIAGNRDEYFARPTAPLHEWLTDSGQRVMGGRDLRERGTWAGFTPEGRFAMLTNVRDGSAEASYPRSRGELVVQWLESRLPATDWAATLRGADHGGFNLIVGDWRTQQIHALSNRPRSQITCLALTPGHIHGLSNAALDTPWPKTEQLKATLGRALPQPDSLHEQLLPALLDARLAPDHALPQTGVPLQAERLLSSAFVRIRTSEDAAAHYGTRASWMAQLDATGQLLLREWTHAANHINSDQPTLARLQL
jgi:uncharacterized protein with NRDE domain